MNPKLLRMYSDILGEQAATPQTPSQSQIATGMAKQGQLVQARTPKPAALKPASTSQNIKAAGAAFQSQQPAQTTPGGGPSNAAQLAAKLGQTAPATAPAAPASNPNAPNQIDTSKPAAATGTGGGFQGGGYGSVGTPAQTASKPPPAGLAAATTGGGFTDPSNKPAPAASAATPAPDSGSSMTNPANAALGQTGAGSSSYTSPAGMSGIDNTKPVQATTGTAVGTGTAGVNLTSTDGKTVTSGAGIKKDAFGTPQFEEELEEETDESLEEQLEEAFNDMLRLSGIQLNEKAVSKQQQKFMGMVHAMQKGKKVKGASPELKKVAKGMGKKAAKDFASTKHKGLPQKVSESIMLEAGTNLEHIVTRFKHETKRFLAGEDLDSDLYEALYDYYADAGEMPYGIAKAREGDPYQWVSDHFADELALMGYDRQFQETVMPVVDNQLSELARLAGLSESRVDECGDMGMDTEDRLNVSTNMSSDGTKSVNISAQGDKAEELLSMLKLAGMGGSDRPAMVMIDKDEEMMDEERETEYANTPEEEYETVAAITRQGNDLNREKKQFANMPKAGDNPMATDYMLDEELSALLDSILVKEADPQRPKGDTGIADIYTADKGQPPSPDEGPINYPKKIQPQQPKATEPSMKNMPLPKDAPEPRMKNMPLPKGQEPRTKPM